MEEWCHSRRTKGRLGPISYPVTSGSQRKGRDTPIEFADTRGLEDSKEPTWGHERETIKVIQQINNKSEKNVPPVQDS